MIGNVCWIVYFFLKGSFATVSVTIAILRMYVFNKKPQTQVLESDTQSQKLVNKITL